MTRSTHWQALALLLLPLFLLGAQGVVSTAHAAVLPVGAAPALAGIDVPAPEERPISYSRFNTLLSEDAVISVTQRGRHLYVTLQTGETVRTFHRADRTLPSRLAQAGVPLMIEPPGPHERRMDAVAFWGSIAIVLIAALGAVLAQSWLSAGRRPMGREE